MRSLAGPSLPSTRRRTPRPTGMRRVTAAVTTALLTVGLTGGLAAPASAVVAPVGQGFTVTPADLAFVLEQIRIAEQHAATQTPDDPCGTLVGAGAFQIKDRISPFGLRTVDGSCNNLYAGNEHLAGSDQVFPRLASTTLNDADLSPAMFGPQRPTSYRQVKGSVFDAQPRMISNLVSDQTSANPAAVAAAGRPMRSQNQAGYVPCTTDPDPVAGVEGSPVGCIPAGQSLPIPNITTDVGLSPPFNGVFTLFGQFFDHGIDQTVKGGGTVFVPLAPTDPLVAGPDHAFGTADDVPASQRFMVLSRARNQVGPDGVLGTADDVHDAKNTDTPWVDLSQTYTSHPSHQVFLREYTSVTGTPVDTGRLLGGLPGSVGETGMATWASVKRQAAEVLGLQLVDADATDVPMLAVDPYGNFLPGPHGLPQYVTRSGLVEGDLASPVRVPADAVHFDTPFLTDIAHNADPSPQDLDHDPATPPAAPAPDADATASSDVAAQVPGTYDDELLDAHFIAGDGRANENIGLSSIHQVFESEHNRLVADIDRVLREDTSAKGQAALATWRGAGPAGWGYGQRLFQAARFVTEMEYQHIVFEEFARKLQPGLVPFAAYHPEIDASIPAEFAHAVYRFGHSMLTDTIGRTAPDTTDYSIPLLDGFLNPVEYFRDQHGDPVSPQAAAGGILMGMSDQVGAEIDEFVPETLRNNLLGLPLDLATLNLARGRSEGVPTLNRFRRELHDLTNDGQLTPYASWNDFGQSLKHPESLVNLVAAYGTHPTVRDSGPDGQAGTDDDVTTAKAKRAAAQALVNPTDGTMPTQDAIDFLESTGAWADRPTGLDSVDLWIGGLAEATAPFGGHLGSTFNYVFENTLANLQNGDRFYYLNRLPGLNLLAQVDGGSLAELIQRNTDNTHSLKADVFAVADCRFQLAHLDGTKDGYARSGSTVADDPTTPCDERALLLRKPDGTLQYRATNTVDPAGINGQAVYNGSAGADRVVGGNDNDTFWGNGGDNRIETSTGDDVALGGEGDDVLTDAGGLDVLKGGPGDDAIDAGPGLDILFGGAGKDVTNGGAGDNETFAGLGDDFSLLGTGNDTYLGGQGSDWAEGGLGVDALSGDEGGLIPGLRGNDPAGHDILVGGAGDTAYDGENGDDIMAGGQSLDHFFGGGGYDWTIHQFDTAGTEDDMLVNGGGPGGGGVVAVNRDRWLENEGLSGSNFDDVLRGDNEVQRLVSGGGLEGCDVLDQAGINRVKGLGALLPAPSFDVAPVAALSAARDCPQTGPVWGEGNILLGGGGSDVFEGRGGDDVIDGDRMIQVRLSVRTDPADPATEIGSTTSLEKPYRAGSTKTLQAAVFDGTVSPRQLVAVREIVTAPADGSQDRALFFGARSDYTIVRNADGSVTVTQTAPLLKQLGQKWVDGADTLRNVELLQFSDRTVSTAPPAAPTITKVTATADTATVTWTPAPVGDRVPNTGFVIQVLAGGQVVRTVTGIASTTTTYVVGRLTPGTAYAFQVRAMNTFGPGEWSAPTAPVTPVATAPSAPTFVDGTASSGSVSLTWVAGSDGGSPVNGWNVQVLKGTTLVKTVTVAGAAPEGTVTGLTNGTAYTFKVQALNAVGTSPWSTASGAITPGNPPGAPTIGAAAQGAKGGALTAIANWTAPKSTGGSPITGYQVAAYLVNPNGSLTLDKLVTAVPSARKYEFSLAAGTYRFQVVALNAVGDSPPSSLSATVRPR